MKITVWQQTETGMDKHEMEIDMEQVGYFESVNRKIYNKSGGFRKFYARHYVLVAQNLYGIPPSQFQILRETFKGKVTRESTPVFAQKKTQFGWAERSVSNVRYTVKGG